MPKKRKLDPIVGWMYFLIGISQAVEISLEHPFGLFLRDSYNKNMKRDPNTVSKTFIINEPAEYYKVKAQNGPFESHQTVRKSILDTVASKTRKNSSVMHRRVVYNMDVSVHIVTRDISPKLPRLQVLVHASPFQKSQSPNNQNRYWCAQVFVEANNSELSSVCILNEKDQVCVVGIDLHKEWWTKNGTSVRVSYSFNGIDQNDQCASASNAIIPVKSIQNNNESGIQKQEICTLSLAHNEQSFEEWKDQDILIDVPREMFHQSDSFEIPIRLEKNSDLQIFVMRARVRQGLRITGARMTDPSSQWSIHVDIKEHQKTGTVTAFVRDAKIYKKSESVLDVFRWQMEVSEDTYDTRDMGRVVWSIEYQGDGAHKEMYTSQDSKIVSQINIRSKDQQRLVPVLKESEIVNVAMLTGWEQTYPLRIYAVDDTDKFKDVTQQTKCHSVEVDVLKVASDCMSVYVDGAESRGSHNVSIIAKSGHTTAFMDITVWVPEDHLDIQLSDSQLSRIRNWRVPAKTKRSRRSVNPFLEKSNTPAGSRCELQRQQSTVNVYTRFYIQTPKQTDFFMGPGAFLKVTDLVKNRLRMSDTRIATLSGNLIQGVEEGRTEIQLLSPRNGHVLAAKEIQVSHDKVSIKRLELKLTTGLTLDLEPSDSVDGAITAKAVIDGHLLSNYQEGIIDVSVVFSDMKTLPLRSVSPEDYFLETMTLNHNIIGVAVSKTPYQPHIVATGEGHGELVKVTLKLSESCKRKKSRPLAANTMYIDVNYSQKRRVSDETKYQKDAHYDTNRPSDRGHKPYRKKPHYKLPQDGKTYPAAKFPEHKSSSKDTAQVIVIKENDFDQFVQKDDDDAKREPLRAKTDAGLSPLEIGMYVLLGVFCVAMTVFMVNCIVFFMRYKRKQKPRKAARDAISNANDWVWIGRATLERNSLYTRSSRTLMAEEDFNGNVNTTRPLSTSSNVSSSSSSSTGPSGPSTTSGPSSNRNSTVSTYRGSECSIRITANPLTEEGAMGGPVPEETRSEGGGAQWDYEAMGMNYDQLLEYFDKLKESTA